MFQKYTPRIFFSSYILKVNPFSIAYFIAILNFGRNSLNFLRRTSCGFTSIKEVYHKAITYVGYD